MDIPPVAARLLDDVNRHFHRRVPGFAAETLAAFAAHRWPGNVRELANEIQRMVALSDRDDPLGAELLSPTCVPRRRIRRRRTAARSRTGSKRWSGR